MEEQMEGDYRFLQDKVDGFLYKHSDEVVTKLAPTNLGLIQSRSVGPINEITIGVLEVPLTLNPKSILDWTKVAWYLQEDFPHRPHSTEARRLPRQLWLSEWGVMGHVRPIAATNDYHPIGAWQRGQNIIQEDGWPTKAEEIKLRAELFGMLKAVGAIALNHKDIKALIRSGE